MGYKGDLLKINCGKIPGKLAAVDERFGLGDTYNNYYVPICDKEYYKCRHLQL